MKNKDNKIVVSKEVKELQKEFKRFRNSLIYLSIVGFLFFGYVLFQALVSK